MAPAGGFAFRTTTMPFGLPKKIGKFREISPRKILALAHAHDVDELCRAQWGAPSRDPAHPSEFLAGPDVPLVPVPHDFLAHYDGRLWVRSIVCPCDFLRAEREADAGERRGSPRGAESAAVGIHLPRSPQILYPPFTHRRAFGGRARDMGGNETGLRIG